eukprot:Colp12_sorted_trinity150504_noHs@9974
MANIIPEVKRGHSRNKSLADRFNDAIANINVQQTNVRRSASLSQQTREIIGRARSESQSSNAGDREKDEAKDKHIELTTRDNKGSLSAPTNHGRAMTFSSVPPAALKNEHWKQLSQYISQMFQSKQVDKPLSNLNELVNAILNSDAGPHLQPLFANLHTKGMIILRERTKDLTGTAFVDTLSGVWKTFYCSILPTLQAIFLPARDFDLRPISLAAFRDHVVLQSGVRQKLEDAVSQPGFKCADIIQMLLVLQTLRRGDANESIICSLLARLIPFLAEKQDNNLSVVASVQHDEELSEDIPVVDSPSRTSSIDYSVHSASFEGVEAPEMLPSVTITTPSRPLSEISSVMVPTSPHSSLSPGVRRKVSKRVGISDITD